MFSLEKGEALHSRAEQARERGDFVSALKNTDEAMVAYQQEGNIPKLAEVNASRFLAFRHLWEETGEKAYLVLAKHTAEAGVELAKLTGEESALALPLYNLAKAKVTLGEFEAAVSDFEEVLKIMETSPPKDHDRVGVRADMKAHLGVARYRAGNRDGVGEVRQAIEELGKSDEPRFNKDVWLSGAHMQLAETLKETNKEESALELARAREIIDDNPDLILRAKQWQKLATELGVEV